MRSAVPVHSTALEPGSFADFLMFLEVALSPLEIPGRADLAGKNVVVIDVLRATSTIVQAIASGCRRVIPMDGIAEARRQAAESAAESVLLAGEWNGVRPAGFDLGNSPREFTTAAVSGRTIVMATTNGTRALHRVRDAHRILAGCFRNLTATAAAVAAAGRDALIVCSGQAGTPSLEDIACAGALARRIQGLAGPGCLVGDPVIVAQCVLDAQPSILAILRGSSHGRDLSRLGFDADLELCAEADATEIVAEMRDGAVVRAMPGQP